MSACEHHRRLSAYHDGELPAAECGALEEHLRQCRSCAQELEQLRGLSGLFAAVEMPEMSSGALNRVHGNVCATREGITARLAGALTAAAAAVLLVCSAWLWRETWVREETDDGSPRAWERTALTLQLDVSSSANGQMQLAQWIVEDLSLENGHD